MIKNPLIALPVLLLIAICGLSFLLASWLLPSRYPAAIGCNAFTLLSLGITLVAFAAALAVWRIWFPSSYKRLYPRPKGPDGEGSGRADGEGRG